jgi:alpha-L-arabinofuranosidase
MNRYRIVLVVLSLFLLAGLTAARAEDSSITVKVDQPAHPVAPTLWGIFFEDINLSADGGIYPELVRNRSFEDADKPEYWAAIGGATLAVDKSKPVSAKNPQCLRVESKAAGDGVVNEGYWGMAMVEGDRYLLNLLACGKGTLKVTIENSDGSATYATQELGPLGDTWKPLQAELTATGTDPKARLVIRAKQTGTCWLDMVSLMPAKTWKGHGLRPDLCEMLVGLKPAFMRFPGGCWVEGDTMDKAYRWKKTIGDISEREPLWNIWGYKATHGLGYHEYLQLSEDLGAEPLFCINVGMSHKEVVPMEKMGEFVQDALDAIEYANGPADSQWGALRAKAGHPEPFNLKYVEIGNENGGPAYHERWPLFYKAIKAKYPNIQLIANVWGGYPTNEIPEIVDEHYYSNPEFFIENAGKYDKYDRDGPKIFVGEYAVTQNCGAGNLRGAVGEAAFMIGMERNSDIVTMASYAPLFVNVNHKRWNPDLINFDSSRVYGLPSYFVQQMFAQNRGDVVLPTVVRAQEVAPKAKGGAVGVGTWATQAEFKDIKVTQGDKVLFESNFADGTKGWRLHGGNWTVKDGALQQTGRGDNIRAFIGDKSWTNYTLTLKARKLGGAEGFLISFGVQDDNAKAWWNIGGWGNVRHALEVGGVPDSSVNGKIETGKWYDIRVELQGNSIKCYLDGKLLHDVESVAQQSLYASATSTPENVIVKVVNVTEEPQATDIDLQGVTKVSGPLTATVLTSAAGTDENSLDEPTKVAPVSQSVAISGPQFRFTFPPNSVTVLKVNATK